MFRNVRSFIVRRGIGPDEADDILPGAEMRFRDRLLANQVQISVYPNGVRISPSIYNSQEDIGQLIRVLSA